MKRFLIILLVIMGVLIMLKPVSALIRDSVGNIVYRGNVVTGTVAVVNGNGSYDVNIGESAEAYPSIFTLAREPELEIGDKVRILYENGIKELPIILPPKGATTPVVVSGDLIACCEETHQIWRFNGVSNEIKDTLDTVIYGPSGAVVVNGNLVTVGYVVSEGYDLLIAVHDGFSSTITSTFAPPGDYPSALGFDGTNLLSADWGTQKIYIHNGISGSVSSSFDSPGSLPRGLVVVNGNLISCDGTADKVYFHSGITSTISSSFDCPDNPESSYPNPAANGLTTDGTNLIMGDNGAFSTEDDVIFVFSGYTSAVSQTLTAPSGCKRICGLAYMN